MSPLASRPYDRYKRLLDVAASALALVVSMPIQAVVAGLVAISLGRPVLFRQQRAGRHGAVFTLVKFRTMKDVDTVNGLKTDEERLTAFGRALRSTSLDELPTLFNVLKGDMSMVGPRPLLIVYLERYTPRQSRRHEVRPGITGLAQVEGRNSLGWEDRFELDVRYVDTRSPQLDARILMKTVGSVLSRRGVSAEGHATMTEFLPHHFRFEDPID